jgi:hypothetical protein
MRILALDPGTRSFAVSVMNIRFKESVSFKCEGTAMLPGKVIHKNMIDIRPSLNKFLDYMDPLVSQDFDAFVVERYQSRGGKGPTIESINTMIGALIPRLGHIPYVKCYLAGTWKNAFNRFGFLNEMYEDHKVLRTDKSKSHIQIHELDASLMAFYVASKQQNVKPFEFIRNRNVEHRLLTLLDGAPKLKW